MYEKFLNQKIMSNKNDVEFLLNLIKTKKLDLLAYAYDQLEPSVKDALIQWLQSESFPTDNPSDLIGNEYVIAGFNTNFKLIIFTLSYEGEEQCGGTIVFSLDGQNCKYIMDTVECSS